MISLITHHLDLESADRFMAWFSRLRAALQQQQGFVSVRAFTEAADPRARHVLLEMENEAALRAWTSGGEKKPLLREIQSAATRPWTALRLQEIGE
jgi:heme-degrading monooxygenase HmoA